MEVAVQAGEASEGHDRDEGPRHASPASGIRGEDQGRDGRKGADSDHETWPVEDDEEEHQQHATEGGADEVGRVQAVHLLRKTGQRKADDHAAEHEGHGDDRAREHDRPRPRQVPGRLERDRELRDEADGERDAEEQRVPPQVRPDVDVAEPPGPQVDEQRADGEPEERD